jgi:hypothetical protein
VHIHFLYPSHPLDPKQPDEKTCRIRGPIPEGATAVYRGWMLSLGEYEQLVTLIESNRATPFISTEMYLACHHLPNWYPLISEFTPETKVLPLNSDFVGELRGLGWEQFFIKDYVKSLKTSRGSVISKPEDISTVLSEMQEFRGVIEGGVCVRRFEQFVPGSETRYFVIRGKSYAVSGSVPGIVHECARRINSHFFSVDVAMRTDSLLRVVEIGDGQVSDLVGWEPACFAELWK